jgi:hypothetical protein
MGRNKLSIVVPACGLVALLFGAQACRSKEDEVLVLERVAEVEHEQWMAWSKSVANEVSPERRKRWEAYWVPYKELPEEVKELDREWARKALKAAGH